MIISSFFTDQWQPKEWLTPLITIYNVITNNKVVDNQQCSEVGWWFYKYDFVDYNSDWAYSIFVDWWSELQDWERYSVTWNWEQWKLTEQEKVLDEIKHYVHSANRNTQYNHILTKFKDLKKILEEELKKENKPEIVEIVKEIPVIQEKLKEIDYWLIENIVSKTIKQSHLQNLRNKARMLLKRKINFLKSKI